MSRQDRPLLSAFFGTQKESIMKKSKSSSTSERRVRSWSRESRRKRDKKSPHSKEKIKSKEKPKVSRKSRWEDANTDHKKIEKQAEPLLPSVPKKEEKINLEHSSRIRDLVDERPKIVEHLFLTVVGTALEQLIPDYLKKLSIEELKKLCLEELEKMSKDEILSIISGNSSLPEEIPSVNENVELKETSSVSEDIKPTEESQNSSGNLTNDSAANDVLVLCASPGEKISIDDDENQAPVEILEKVAQDLGVSEGDAELLELEMRARAIRSLLKIKSQDEFDSEVAEFDRKFNDVS